MTPALIGNIIGALAITYLLSRLFLWLMKKLTNPAKIVFSHLLTLVFVFVASAFGYADGGPLRWDAGWVYAMPIAMWLVVDLFLASKTKAKN